MRFALDDGWVVEREQDLPVPAFRRLPKAPHDLYVLLRHRPRSIHPEREEGQSRRRYGGPRNRGPCMRSRFSASRIRRSSTSADPPDLRWGCRVRARFGHSSSSAHRAPRTSDLGLAGRRNNYRMASADSEPSRIERWFDRLDAWGETFWSPEKRRLRLAIWISAFALAALGGVLYLVFGTSVWWWIGSAVGVPLFLLITSRQSWLEEKHGRSDSRTAASPKGRGDRLKPATWTTIRRLCLEMIRAPACLARRGALDDG
jgi:hypothetical protein